MKKKKENIPNYKQEVDINENIINDFEIEGLKLEKGQIEKVGEMYHITLMVENNTKESIDLSDYRISFRNHKNDEIEWYSGSVIGNIVAGEKKEIVIDSYQNLADLTTIFYEKDFYQN